VNAVQRQPSSRAAAARLRAWPVSDLETVKRFACSDAPMTERAGVVAKLATPIRMLPTTERCRLISAHKKYPAQAELTQHRFKVSGIGDLRGDNDVQRPPLANCIKRSRVARGTKPYCLRPSCLMCGRRFVGTRRNPRAEGASLRKSGRAVQGRKLRRQMLRAADTG
jgi:hypothetical protein